MRRNEAGYKEAQRRQNHDKQRYFQRLPEHEDQRDENRDDTGKQLRESEQQSVAQLIRIRNHAADQITGAVTIQILQGKALDLPDCLCPDLLNCPVSDAVVDEIHDICRRSSRSNEHEDFRENPCN